MKQNLVVPIISLAIPINAAYAQAEPPVKMSSAGICHAQGSTYYNQTKKFTAYKTANVCLKAGGRVLRK